MQSIRKNNSTKSMLNAVSGITLIALVVTIVVLLILASVSITVVFGDNGLLKLAKDAGEKTEKASEDEQNTILRYEYELAKLQGKISETETFEEYLMEKEIKEKYGQDIKIGDTVNYQDDVEEYNGTWKVLGIENGQILLMSSNPVNKDFAIEGREGFLNLETKLNNECEKYGKGTGAKSARSLRAEDINRISGYNPENSGGLGNIFEGRVDEYSKTVTFTLDNGYLKCKCSNGKSLNTNLSSFEHADGRKLGEGVSEITILNSEYAYRWTPGEYVTYGKDKSLHKLISDGIKRLFFDNLNKDMNWIWLANAIIRTNDDVSRRR